MKNKNGVSLIVLTMIVILLVLLLVFVTVMINKGEQPNANEINSDTDINTNEINSNVDTNTNEIDSDVDTNTSEINPDIDINSGDETDILNGKNEYELKIGKYNISYNAYTSSLTEEERFEIGSYYDDMPIRFFEDSTFEISFPEDIVISGEYKIAENKVICTCKTFGFLLGEIDEYYNVKNEDFEYIFEFVDENSIKVVEINSPDYTHGPFVDEDVSVGNIYTYEEN